jgi:hypothetical protein
MYPAEEGQHPLGEERGCGRVVGGQGGVGEVVLVAGVEEQLRVLRLLHERPRGIAVALVDDDRVGLHPVHLDRNAGGPGRPELRHRHARREQQRGRAPGRVCASA